MACGGKGDISNTKREKHKLNLLPPGVTGYFKQMERPGAMVSISFHHLRFRTYDINGRKGRIISSSLLRCRKF